MYYILRINLRIMNYSKTVKKIVEFYIYKKYIIMMVMSKYVFLKNKRVCVKKERVFKFIKTRTRTN